MSTYNINKHTSVLTPVKGSKTKYHCPVCNGHNLDIKTSTGEYNCFSGGCDVKDIRAAIDRLEGKPEWKPKRDDWKKPVRPKTQKEYFYPDRDGRPLVKVVRIDCGDGKKRFPQSHWDGSKWVTGNPDEVKKLVPIYRRAEVREAIGRGELVFIIEGEAAVDAAWELGIPATTTIGGAGKFSKYGDYTTDLEGGQFALAPDRDAIGVNHMEEIAKFLGDRVKGYYLAGTQGLWRNPQGAMDIGDDIRDHQLTKEQILTKVITVQEYTKSYQQISTVSESSSVTSVEGADKQSATYQQLSAAEIKKQVEEIVERHLPAVDRQTELIALSRRLGVSKISLDGLVQELEHATSNSADNAEMDKILIAQSHKLSPHLVLPAQLANKIEQISNARSTNPEPLLLGLLVAASSVPHANTRLDVRNYGDVLSVYPNLFGMVVGDSSMLKSPTIKSTYIKPLKALRKIFIEKYKTELDQYTSELTKWEAQDKKDRGQEPKSPTLTVVSAVDTTIEKLEELALNQPHICPSLFRDEVIGIFQSFDKHGGKGTNDGLSKLLSYYDGQPIDRHRMGTGSQLSEHDFHPSVFGGIQPEVLKKLAIGIGMDDAGTLCRFLYAPISRTYKDWDEEPDRELIDVSAFDRLICKINQLPPLVCSFDRAGQQAWAKIANRHNKACLNNPHISQWLKHSYSKAIGQLGKIALTLHLIECVTAEKVSAVISAATIDRAGIALDYFISQAISLIAATEETLEAHLVRILDKAKKLGSIKPRDVQALFSGKKRIDSTTARNYLQQLVQSGYGGVDDAGVFTPNQLGSAPTANADNADKVLITYQQPEDSPAVCLNNNVDNADNILQSNILFNSTDTSGVDPSRSTNGSSPVPPTFNGGEGADKQSADYQQSPLCIGIGSRVKYADDYHVRGSDIGVVEKIEKGNFQVWWQSDGDRQIPTAHRTFAIDELVSMPDSDSDSNSNKN
jgi:Protein of unknown function (DUF3987)